MRDEIESRKAELETKRAELRDRLERINLDYRKGLDRDLEEQAQELENAAVLDEIARVTAEELARIEQAIERIEQATQGNR